MTDSIDELLVAARFALEHSGDHGCDWCQFSAFGCKQCEAYHKLKAALEPFGTPP